MIPMHIIHGRRNFIFCGYTVALYAMTTSTDQQILDYQALLDTHVFAEFAAAVPIMKFMMEEGIEVFTNLRMK